MNSIFNPFILTYERSKLTSKNEVFMTKEELHELIETEQQNICQIEVIRDDKTVYADTWNNYKSDDCVHVMSVTKSIMALLVGIAIDKGQIKSVDDKVLDYFPEYKVKRGENNLRCDHKTSAYDASSV